MTGLYDKVNPHTLGMTVAEAVAIENELRINQALTEAYRRSVKRLMRQRTLNAG